MNDFLLKAKGGVALIVSTAGAFLGWQGVLAVVWLASMALDYISGTAAACKEGSWSSAVARAGLWHKAGMIVSVIAAGLADIVLALICDNIPQVYMDWPGLVLPLVLAWYVITELGSILENAARMGAPVPSWLVQWLAAGKAAVDAAGGADNAG